MDGTILPTLPELKLFTSPDKINAEDLVTKWLSRLQECFNLRKFESLDELLVKDAWWRDILGLGWDFSTKQGNDKIIQHLTCSKVVVGDLKPCSFGGLKPAIIEWDGQTWIQSAFTFTTEHGKCCGLVRLQNDSEMSWKAWTVYTELKELHYQEALEIRRCQSRAATCKRPVENGNHAAQDPDVLIVGAGT